MINTLWSIRTETLMLEEYLSTVTVSSLTGEVKDVLIDEVVRFSGEDNSDEVENARENCGGFHNKILSGLSSVIHVGCLEKPMEGFVGGITHNHFHFLVTSSGRSESYSEANTSDCQNKTSMSLREAR